MDPDLSTHFKPAEEMTNGKVFMSDTEALRTEINIRFRDSYRREETIGLSVWKYHPEAVSKVSEELEIAGYKVFLNDQKNLSIKMH